MSERVVEMPIARADAERECGMNAMPESRLPLSGIRILDFSWGGAGPFATKALADHGAEVIKIETSTHFDFPRTMGPYANKTKGINRSAYFSNRNSSKLGTALNLKNKEAVALTKRLVPSCDIVVNNFRAGVLDKLGLGFQDCAELRSDIIYVSMPMQGSGGPQAGYSGVGHTLNVLGGIFGVTGYKDGMVVGPGTNFPDHSVNPGHALAAIMAALIYRKKTGLGQYIEISQLESTINLLGPYVLAYSLNGVNPKPEGNTSRTAAPYGAFPCRDKEWIAISVSTDAQWRALCAKASGEPSGESWAGNARFATSPDRLAAADELNGAVGEWTKHADAFTLMNELQAAGVPAGVVQTAKDLVDRDPQLALREQFVQLTDHPEMGPTVYNGVPYKLSRTPGYLRHSAPTLGQHNEVVFKGLLGLDGQEFERLQQAGVFK
jgi:benzylsuccinate CoA-transferase BbsF subunit